MQTNANHFKIGLFILAGLGLFLAALFAFGARSYFEEKTVFESYVQGDVEGLSLGSPVKLRGVNVGKVTRIGFTWEEYPDDAKGNILVEFELRKIGDLPRLQNDIKKGLRVRVKSLGITGTSFVSLEYVRREDNPEVPVSWTPRHAYIPSAESQFGQMLSAIEKTLRNVEKVDFVKLSQALDSNLELIERLLKKLERVDAPAIASNANALVVSMRLSSDHLREFMSKTETTMRGMRLESVGQNAETLLAGLQKTNERLKTLLEQFDMDTANDALGGVRQLAVQLQEVLAELKRYPSGFIFGEPPPPASAVKSRKP